MGEEELNLSSTYPRKELTEDMDDGTLTQLGLVSAIIVVRFKRVRVLFFTIYFMFYFFTTCLCFTIPWSIHWLMC